MGKDDFGAMIARAKAGEDEAAADLYARYARRVAHRVRQRLGAGLRRHYETDDITDSVFGEVLRDLPQFEDRGEDAFVHWLCIKAENKVREKHRKHFRNGRRRQTTLDEAAGDAVPSAGEAPGDRLAADEEHARIERLVASLDPLDADIFRLHARDRLPFAAIAARQGLASADAARKRYARALVALRARSGAES